MEDSCSLVHTEETTQHPTPLPSYREHLAIKAGDEYSAAEILYEAVSIDGNPNIILNFRTCRSRAWFVRHDVTGQIKVASNACRLRWCPFCANAKRWLITKNVEAFLDANADKRFITLTLKHSDETLENQISRLYNHFKNLRRTVDWQYHVFGGVWFFQLKKSDASQQWHPHLHILATGRFWHRESISALWLKITGDSMVVDVRSIHSNRKAAEYVARYSSKPTELNSNTVQTNLNIYAALKGKRLCGTFGTAKSIQLTTKRTEEIKHFQKLQTWSEIVNNLQTNKEYADIWNAYKSNEPLDYIPECLLLNNTFDEETNIDPPAPVPKQNWLF
jgi:glutaredoxin